MLWRHVPREVSRSIRGALGLNRQKRVSYWEKRQNALYLQEVRRLVNETSAQSILDVGSNGCGYLDWFPSIPRRASLDIERPYQADGVESIQADFLTHPLAERFDVVLCLRVMEHIPQATAFAERLLASTQRHLIVSVPYRWAVGTARGHVHDPVDEAKLHTWFGREPSFSRIVRETDQTGAARLVCRYDN